MGRIPKFFINNFFKVFIPLFFTLFFIASIMFFIMIARFTSYLSLSFAELGEMFIYLLPKIIIYTLPVSFFVSMAINAFNMSKESENIVLFSFGYSPKKMAKVYFFLAFFTTLFLLINSIFILPISKQLYKNFLQIKRVEAKINIKPTEFGQKFSDWIVFINRADNKGYKDIILYNQKKSKDTFILANHAKLNKKEGLLNLSLDSGKVFYIQKDSIRQIDFLKMNINNFLSAGNLRDENVFEYWLRAASDKKRAKDFSFLILISAFPMVSYLFALAIATVHIRHDRVRIYPYLFALIIAYYVISVIFAKSFPFIGIFIVPLIFYLISKSMFGYRVLRRF